jgi:hypothetical protein
MSVINSVRVEELPQDVEVGERGTEKLVRRLEKVKSE